MNYRGPDILTVVRFGSSPAPSPPLTIDSLSQSSCVSPSSLLKGEGGRGRRGAKANDNEKAWPSINHSILSGDELGAGPLVI
jgi:hypothetical protein